MRQFLITLAGVFAGLTLFAIAAPIAAIALVGALGAPAAAPARTVLYLDLRGPIPDQAPADPVAVLTSPRLSITNIVLTLRQAERDPRVKGLFVRLPEGGVDPAAADELAQAFRRFRATGRTITAHSQGLYAGGAVVSTYALGAAADRIWMQPGAPFEAVGYSSEEIFLARLFERFGVNAQFEQREDFKNAVNMYIASGFTPAHREAQLSWMTAIMDAALSSIAADRKMTSQAARAAIEGGPYDASGALDHGLIDKVGQVEDARLAALEAAGDGAQLLDFGEYSVPRRRAPRAAIALVNVEGALLTGSSGYDPLAGQIAGSDDIAHAILAAVDEEAIGAIVLRVSSPGGSDIASEQIASAVRAAVEAEKPVVVSMGAYAASGGYWISAEADYIVAQPTTLTGSIGVYGGKISVGEGAERYGIDLESLTVGGDYAGIGALGQPFTPAQRAAYAAQVDQTYANFIDLVARGRSIPAERVRQIAGGRVWTGVQARRLGLVDELGGMTEAIEKAKALAGIEGDARLVVLPEPLSALEAIERLLGVNARAARGIMTAGALLDDRRDRALLQAAAEDRLRARGANLLAR